MKKEILHIDSYVPKGEPTWLFYNESISLVEQIRVITVSHEEWGHDTYIEYVYVTGMGDRGIWSGGGEIAPFDTVDSWIFRGRTIAEEELELMFLKQGKSTREALLQSLVQEVDTYWARQLSFAPGLLKYCKEKDKNTAPS